MKFTLSWLKEHLDTTATVEEIAETLTDLGLEVEGVENPPRSCMTSPSARC
jgi:phenylalanyl-tRNA synthetase beta chain